MKVKKLFDDNIKEVNKNSKRELLELLTAEVSIRKTSGPLLVALERMTASLCRCYTGEDARLEIPEIVVR